MKFPNFLKVATIHGSRMIEVNKTFVPVKFHECAEDMLIKLFSEKLGFSYELVFSEDEQYGKPLTGGNWTGMVGLLQRKKADVIFHRIAITEEREDAMDYSYPYHVENLYFATRHVERRANPETFLRPFTFLVWVAFGTCLCVMPIIFNILFARQHYFRHLITCRLFRKLSAGDARKSSECVLRIFWEFFALIFRWSYIALILSFMLLPSQHGVRTIPELATAIQEGRYQTTASRGSFLPQVLIDTGGYSAVIGENLKEDEGTLDFQDALEKTGLEKEIAVIAAETDLLPLKEKYFISKDEFFPILIVIGISKDFCCKPHLDSIVNYLWSSGIYQHLLKRGVLIEMYEILKQSPFDTVCKNCERSLSLEDFKGVFILLACGYVLSVAVLLCELVYYKCTHL